MHSYLNSRKFQLILLSAALSRSEFDICCLSQRWLPFLLSTITLIFKRIKNKKNDSPRRLDNRLLFFFFFFFLSTTDYCPFFGGNYVIEFCGNYVNPKCYYVYSKMIYSIFRPKSIDYFLICLFLKKCEFFYFRILK